MSNRSASRPATDADLREILELCAALEAKLRGCKVHPSDDERARPLRMRPGGERIVGLVSELAETRGQRLPGAPPSDLRAELEWARRLEPVAEALGALARSVEDTIADTHAECWWMTIGHYTALALAAEEDPTLAESLAPAIDWFAGGRRTLRIAPVAAPLVERAEDPAA
jgi:hypothetical protein